MLARRLFCVSFLLLFAAPACNKKGARTKSAQALATVPATKASPLEIPVATPRQDQLAHFILDDYARFQQILRKAEKLSGTRLPKLLHELQSDPKGVPLADQLAKDKRAGCVLYDPLVYMDEHNWPGVCFFSYQSGVQTFIEELKKISEPMPPAASEEAKPQKHLFAGRWQQRNVFVDAIGDKVVISGHPDRFSASVDYIKKNLLDPPSRDPGIGFQIYLADIYKKYEPLIRAYVKKALKESDSGLASTTLDSTKEGLDTLLGLLSESEQLQLGMHLDEHRLSLSLNHRTKDPAPVFTETLQQRFRSTLDTDLVARMPKDLLLLAASVTQTSYDEGASPLAKNRWLPLAKLLGRDEAWARRMHAGQRQFTAEHLGDQVALGAFATAKGPGAMLLMAKVAKGSSVQKQWREAFKGSSPEDWAPKQRDQLEMSFTPNARRVDGVVLDEFKIVGKEKLRARLQRSMRPDRYRAIINLLGSLSVVVHLGQIEHIAFAVITTHDAAQSSSKVIAALRGVDNFVMHPEFAATASSISGNSFAAFVDSAALGRLLLSGQADPNKATGKARPGLQDSMLIGRLDPKQGLAGLWRTSIPLLPLLTRDKRQEKSEEKEESSGPKAMAR